MRNSNVGFSPLHYYPKGGRLGYTIPFTLRAFVHGTVVECFLDDRYSMSSRNYDHHGRLALEVLQGEVRIQHLNINV